MCVPNSVVLNPFFSSAELHAIRKGYALPNFCVVRLRHRRRRCRRCSRRRKLLVQTLSPLKFMDR